MSRKAAGEARFVQSGAVLRRGTLPKGRATAGVSVGIICIEGVTALWPGNVQNASTFDFPVTYHVLRGVAFEQIACGDDSVTDSVVAAARLLERQGVRAIVGACGSLGHYQRAAAEAVAVPVYMSILAQVPFIVQALASRQRLLAVFASARTYTEKVRLECGIAPDARIVPIGLMALPEFRAMLDPDAELDVGRMAQAFGDEIARHVDESTGAILLQCSDLPPFAAYFQSRFRLPVFDMTGLITWLHNAVARRDFNGFL